MTGAFAGRDGDEVDALVTDRYLEALLAAHARGADHAPAADGADPMPSAGPRTGSPRPAALHPSFRFEEPLASRLAEAASRMRLATAAGGEGLVVPLRGAGSRSRRPRPATDDGDDRARYGRPLLIGGALTSAALSLAGAAYVAWRLNRPTDNPMARAARAVARSRLV